MKLTDMIFPDKKMLLASLLTVLLVNPVLSQTSVPSNAQPGNIPVKEPAQNTTPGETSPGKDMAKKPASPAAPDGITATPLPPLPLPQAKNVTVQAAAPASRQTSPKKVDVLPIKRISLPNHGTEVINLKQAASQVLLTDPKIADIQLVTPTTLYVYGRSPGMTEIIVTGQDMVTAYRYEIHVASDYRELESLIRGFVPTSIVKVHAIPDGLLLQGTVDSAKIAEDIRALAQRYVGAQGTVVSQLKIKSSTQINLRVKIAEVTRSVVNQLGINWSTAPLQNLRFGLFTGRPNTIANTTGGLPTNFLQSTSSSQPGSIGANFPTNIGNTDFSSLIDALAQESLATVLAEPNLVTRSGEEASFLVGGEYPYTISQGTGTNLTVSIQFKPYGISLSFLPTVVGDTISLRVRPEVSDLDNSITVKDQNGNLIPAIQIRRAESTMDLANGQSMVMAGLLSEQTSGSINNFPGLGDIPILGALFRSVDYQNANTELIIIVTAYIVEPIDNSQDIILPTQGLKFAKLLDMILFDKINEPTGGLPCPGLIGNAGFFY